MMTNEELAAAIRYASSRCDQTIGDHQKLFQQHLQELLRMQLARATGTDE